MSDIIKSSVDMFAAYGYDSAGESLLSDLLGDPQWQDRDDLTPRHGGFNLAVCYAGGSYDNAKDFMDNLIRKDTNVYEPDSNQLVRGYISFYARKLNSH